MRTISVKDLRASIRETLRSLAVACLAALLSHCSEDGGSETPGGGGRDGAGQAGVSVAGRAGASTAGRAGASSGEAGMPEGGAGGDTGAGGDSSGRSSAGKGAGGKGAAGEGGRGGGGTSGTSGGADGGNAGGPAGEGGTGDPCDGVTCSGHGTCAADGTCACDAGFEQVLGDATACVDRDECSGSSACDPLSVCTNSPGGFSCGACPKGHAGTGEAGCTPRCAGAPGPICGCLKVANDGDDAAAVASDGALPFLRVQAAIDFAQAQSTTWRQVCVATGDFAGPIDADLTMRNGVSLYGGYDATSWQRVPHGVTTLLPATALGVLFGADVTRPTSLDGFAIDRFNAGTTSAVTVDGGVGASLVGLSIAAADDSSAGYPDGPDYSYGVSVVNGGQATITGSTLSLMNSRALETAVVRAVGARVVIGSTPAYDNGIFAYGWGKVHGVWLEDASGSQILGNEIEAQGGDDGAPGTEVSVVAVRGSADGVVIAGNEIASGQGRLKTISVELGSCGDTVPVVKDNTVSAAPAAGTVAAPAGPVHGILAGDGCRALVQGNDVSIVGGVGADATGIECGSGCSVLDNRVEPSVDLRNVADAASATVGLACLGCAEVSRNQVLGLHRVLDPLVATLSSTGLIVDGDSTLVDRNDIVGGTSLGSGASLGVKASGSVRIQNNLISGGGGYLDCCSIGAQRSNGIEIEGAVDLNSNYVDSGVPVGPSACTASAVSFVGSNTAVLSNNIIKAACGADLAERVADAHPSVLDHNDLVVIQYGPILYQYQGGSNPASIDDVNALTTSTASGNFSAECRLPLDASSLCRDAGSPAGTPDHDFNGDSRDPVSPDVGPYEWSSTRDLCYGVTCGGHGVCDGSGAGPVCTCDTGFERASGDPLTCVDTDECQVSNGGCDPRVTCTNTQGGRTCGACPPGYYGSGYFDCWPHNACVPETTVPSGGCPAGSCDTDADCEAGHSCKTGCDGCGACIPTESSCTKFPLGPACGCDCKTYFNYRCAFAENIVLHSDSSNCGIGHCTTGSECPNGGCYTYDPSLCAQNGAWCLDEGVLPVKCP